MYVDPDMRAVRFQEKPECPEACSRGADRVLCSMGVYVFKTETLVRRAIDDSKRASSHDFGRDVIPAMIEGGDKVRVFRFTHGTADEPPYWRDIGTLDAYWQANMDLLQEPPVFDLHDPGWPIRSHEPSGPPTMMAVGHREGAARPAEVCNSLIGSGSVIRGARVYNSIIGRGVHIGEGSRVHESVILDGVNIGRDAVLRTTVVDKGNRIPDGYEIGVDPQKDGHRFTISDRGVVVVPKEMPLFRP
jgi:glucose-1-phosphate adenylyltransferase